MKRNSRRHFLTTLGTAMGAMTFGKDLLHASGGFGWLPDPQGRPVTTGPDPWLVDFRYAPRSWQSTYCFPDDPFKSLVGKQGEMLYGHPGVGIELDAFPKTVEFGIGGKDPGAFVSQTMESPVIPVVTTVLGWESCTATLTTFATRGKDEGRVDNVIVEIRTTGTTPVTLAPEIVLKAAGAYTATEHDSRGVVLNPGERPAVFLIADSALTDRTSGDVHRYLLRASEVKPGAVARYFIRFPQEQQPADRLTGGLGHPDDLLAESRRFWTEWKPMQGSVGWNLPDPYAPFIGACTRTMLQSREIVNGKHQFDVGPTVYRGIWAVDSVFLLEAARYIGYDREAQEGLEAVWNLEDHSGLILSGAGKAHWKDTPAAIYSLVRQAELSQNWDYFREMYPDAQKAAMALSALMEKARNDGSFNGSFGLLPDGFGDSGIGGIRSEFTNTLWTMIALRVLLDVADRFLLERRTEIREFYGTLRGNFFAAIRKEMKTHPNGFTYLPMLPSTDPAWNDPDPAKRPKPQAAQIYMAHAIYPGLLFTPENGMVKGFMSLMEASMKEDVPFENGWLKHDAVWPYSAAIVAQAFLWNRRPDIARRLFYGFLNHASPLRAWREEQSLHDAAVYQVIGDMPHNWAGAECIRFLRHMLVLEDAAVLRLIPGLGDQEISAGKPFGITSTPTRWGRVSLTLEPLGDIRWTMKFKRDRFDQSTCPKLDWVEMPDRLPGRFLLEKMTGAEVKRSLRTIVLSSSATEWECTFRKA